MNIHRLARLTPALHRQAANEAEAPTVGLTHALKLGCGVDQRVHGRRIFWNRRCCSISPDVGVGARGASR